MNSDLYQTVVHAFFPSDKVAEVAPVGAGLINQTFFVRLEGQEQRWLLQAIHAGLFKDPTALMDNFAAIARHLSGQEGYPLRIAAPVPTSDGALCTTAPDGSVWRILPFFEDAFAPEHLPSRAQAYEAAKAYGLFLSALRTFPAETLYQPLPGFHDTLARYEQFKIVVVNDPVGRKKDVEKEIEQVLNAAVYAEKVAEMIQNGTLPVRVTHNDTKAGNVLLDGTTGKAVSVIDWDTVMPGTVLSDYGDMVRTFVPNCYEDAPAETLELRRDIWAALDEGFLETTADFLTPAEREHLHLGAAWIVTEQALRFLTDYIAGDVYYKTKYPEHNLVRARNQLSIVSQMGQEK